MKVTSGNAVEFFRNCVGQYEQATCLNGEVFRASSPNGDLSIFVNRSSDLFFDLYFRYNNLRKIDSLVGACTQAHFELFASKL